jgi:hypothetical protein
MGTNPTQAVGVTAFLLGFTALSGGLYAGKIIFYVLGILFLAASVAAFLKAKPLENAEN